MQANQPSKQIKELNTVLFKKAMMNGVAFLRENMELVNELNVFPVPDGDTGTNMYLTLYEACQDLDKVDAKSISQLATTLSKGTMMSARGNSGVILSQLMRGFSEALVGNKSLTPSLLAYSLDHASKVAYKAVIKPVEGTILTVARSVGQGALEAAEKGGHLAQVLEAGIRLGEETLEKTPQMLDVLARAGVVDAGGQGYIFFLQGLLEALQGKRYRRLDNELKVITPKKTSLDISAEEELEFVYCTELLIRGEDLPLERFRKDLSSYGDSLLVVGAKDVVRIHVHTNNPGSVLEYGLNWGSLSRININNMEEQKEEHLHSWEKKKKEREKTLEREERIEEEEIQQIEEGLGVIAVVPGEGLKSIFMGLGVDTVIQGGQGENPSTRDLVEAVKDLASERVIILPNNKNIIFAAEQVQELTSQEVFVIPTKSIPQGIASLMNYSSTEEIETLLEEMHRGLKEVKSGELTYAIRDSELNGHTIKKGDILGLYDGTLQVVTSHCQEGLLSLLEIMIDEEDTLITLYQGLDLEEKESLNLKEAVEERFSSLDVEVYQGDQPLYYYYISVE